MDPIDERKAAREADIKSRQIKIKAKRLVRSVLILVILVVIAGFVWYKISHKAPVTQPPGAFYPFQSRDHITVGTTHAEYNSNPPTGGWHYDTPAKTGIYDKEIP